ncbi:MAG TPA: hypothetical protein PKL13_04125 [bacterium]|nr:hypothetical protein [bacterium]
MKQGLKTYIATTLPNLIPSLIFGTFNEGVIGLDPVHLGISRILAITYRLLFSEIFYKLVGRVLLRFNHKKGEPLKYWLINSICSIIFWIGIYFITLIVIGVSINKIVVVVILPIISAFLSGTPIRWIADQLIRFFNIPKDQKSIDYIISEINNLLRNTMRFKKNV